MQILPTSLHLSIQEQCPRPPYHEMLPLKRMPIKFSHSTNANIRSSSSHHLSSRRGIYHLPLLIQPAPRSILPTLQHHMVALQSTRKIVPGGRNQCVLTEEILYHSFICRLHKVIRSVLTVTTFQMTNILRGAGKRMCKRKNL
jgi:hypothetical protein